MGMNRASIVAFAILFWAALLGSCKSAGDNQDLGEGSPTVSLFFTYQDAIGDLAPNTVVYTDIDLADRKLMSQPLVQGMQSIEVPKGGHYVLGFVDEPRSDARRGERGIADAVSLIGSISALAGRLNSFPIARDSSNDISLGNLTASASTGEIESDLDAAAYSASSGMSEDALATVEKFDNAYTKFLNPDIDANGVYDQDEGLEWNLSAKYSGTASYELDGRGTISNVKVVIDSLSLRVAMTRDGLPLLPDQTQMSLELPEGTYVTDDYGIRRAYSTGFYQAENSTVSFKIPVCEGDVEIDVAGSQDSYRISHVSFLGLGTDFDGWIFPLARGSVDVDGYLTKASLAWAMVDGASIVMTDASRAALAYKGRYGIYGSSGSTFRWDESYVFPSPYDPNRGLHLDVEMKDDSTLSLYLQVKTTPYNGPILLDRVWTDAIGCLPSVRPDERDWKRFGDLLIGDGSIYDASDDAAPRYLSSFWAGSAMKLEYTYHEGYLYVADGLSVFDVSDPAAPLLVSELYLGFELGAMICRGRYLYSVSDETLAVFDLADPEWPVLAWSGDSHFVHAWDGLGGEPCREPVIEGDRLYYQSSVFDLSDPAAPKHLYNLPIDLSPDRCTVHCIRYHASHAYLSWKGEDETASGKKIRVFDCRSDSGAVELPNGIGSGFSSPTGYGYGGQLQFLPDGLLCVDFGLLYDVTDPASPVDAGSISGLTDSKRWYSCLYGSKLYCDLQGKDQNEIIGYEVYEVAPGGQATLAARIESGPGSVSDIVAAGGRLAMRKRAVPAIVVRTPGQSGLDAGYWFALPSALGDASIAGLFPVGDYLYVVAGGQGPSSLFVYSLGEGAATLIDELSLTVPMLGDAYPLGFDRQGSRAALCSIYSKTLAILDVEDPAHPRLQGSVSLPSGGTENGSLALNGDYAYLAWRPEASDRSTVLVVDLSSPASPVVVRELGDPAPGENWEVNNVVAVRVVSGVLYIGVTRDVLYLADISDPASPRVTGSVNGARDAATGVRFGVYVVGKVRIFNVSDPLRPSFSMSVSGVGFASFALLGSSIYAVGSATSSSFVAGYSVIRFDLL